MKINDKETLSVAEVVKAVLEGKKIKTETEVQKANKDFVDLHAVDKKKDPEKEKQVESKKEVEEGNEFTKAAAEAKLAGKDEFEFEGKTYPVEISQDAAEKILGKNEETELKEAPMSQGYKTASDQLYSLEKSLKAGSNLNKAINKTLGDNFNSEFRKMEKSLGQILDIWEEIEMAMSFAESTNLKEAPMSQGYKTAETQLYSLEKSLKAGSNLNKAINKALGDDFKPEFRKMEKSLGQILDIWEEIEMAMSFAESTNLEEAKGFPESSQGAKQTYDAVVKLSGSLRKGSNLNKAVNKRLGGKYDSDFVKMEKAITVIFDILEEFDREYQGFDN